MTGTFLAAGTMAINHHQCSAWLKKSQTFQRFITQLHLIIFPRISFCRQMLSSNDKTFLPPAKMFSRQSLVWSPNRLNARPDLVRGRDSPSGPTDEGFSLDSLQHYLRNLLMTYIQIQERITFIHDRLNTSLWMRATKLCSIHIF